MAQGFGEHRGTAAALAAYLALACAAYCLRRLAVGLLAAVLMLCFSPALLAVWAAAKLASLLWRKKARCVLNPLYIYYNVY
jgi:hypothetical protein